MLGFLVWGGDQCGSRASCMHEILYNVRLTRTARSDRTTKRIQRLDQRLHAAITMFDRRKSQHVL
jgi:hypothetical protein